jgi:hypothetical protein
MPIKKNNNGNYQLSYICYVILTFFLSIPHIYWVERKVLAFSKRWPFFEALSYM